MRQSVNPVWDTRSEILYFQFGPFVLWRQPFKALTLLSSPFVLNEDLEIPFDEAKAKGCQGVVSHGVPVARDLLAVRFERGALRYATRYGERYVVDLGGSFAEYLKKFSKKSRHELQRTVRRFVEANGAPADICEFRTPLEMTVFRDIAVAISERSYKREIGLGFQEGASFARQLKIDASAGSVRGYVLMLDGNPAAYGFCRIDHDVIVYKHTGYDEKFAKRSPGRVLLYLMLERLFKEAEFRLLDFDGTAYYPYTAFFSTRSIRCARVVWFRPTILNVAMVTGHWVISAAWRFASVLRDACRVRRRRWISARPRARGLRGWARSD